MINYCQKCHTMVSNRKWVQHQKQHNFETIRANRQLREPERKTDSRHEDPHIREETDAITRDTQVTDNDYMNGTL